MDLLGLISKQHNIRFLVYAFTIVYVIPSQCNREQKSSITGKFSEQQLMHAALSHYRITTLHFVVHFSPGDRTEQAFAHFRFDSGY